MLAATIRDHLKKYKDKFPDTAKIVESSLYVDDFISGQENVDKALQTSLESIEIFKEAGMSLRKWHTNSKELERFWKEIKVLVEEVNCLSDEEVVPLKGFIANKRVQWKFIPDRAPWWGGFYERMVKTVKEPLKKILGRSLLSFEELTTLLSEIENIVNLHPLTYVSDDKDDTEPLTPAHFLYFGRKDFDYPMPFTELFDKTISKETLRRRKLYQTVLLRQLWTRWKEQYLLQL
ncbi:integrase catalytic domain-containing protein [Trichonephila clavata]|uniref:Integrase catalytic domain-containing protein n=1 Tax=Trichonephila clavata TaxID=2740835 RepID=A0A8X6HWG2_TRICU|nr:integrase catalytic domain-containing protein [Trichonephila clavata]